jgi:hypothetical protein
MVVWANLIQKGGDKYEQKGISVIVSHSYTVDSSAGLYNNVGI